ncbi:ligase-associated DNA damage response endonuclease PdeM [Tropicibacter naphthalenivorans]|uniref:Metallophosphoesterase, DNA ligase-associated n=1 Tax=Tropicibacter naphthalenivorans TaxID=441103 RepID=A0A0P1GR29_9RHOB|nr:ligase-associated DNA damage response endonuclease PdeM [Tropicibacter naphthalenivorans]CUH78175.1 metallophosphoesterase, DNA ligase-associated [Tropicibacter naphthalenivorans]SMC93233.1 putative phosphoesterase [Tropicibacter naphthalenivorans]
MKTHGFDFCGARLSALPSGGLFWPDQGLLVVSDLHFGKSARLSAVGGAQLPPYETRETLLRLEADIEATGAGRVICLGDSFDAVGLDAALPEDDRLWITRLQAGRDWTWIEGNHDPGPVSLGGTHLAEVRLGPLVFRHIASDAAAEVSGHYHPKARLALRGGALSRPCFLVDARRLILPAYGAYTGGLSCKRAPLCDMMGPDALAILTGPQPVPVPVARLT